MLGRRQRLLIDQLAFTAPKDRHRLAPLAQVRSLEAAAAMLQSIGIAAERSRGAIDTARTDPEVAAQIERAPAGEPILLPQGDRLVIGVIVGREPIMGSEDAMRLAAARAVRAADLLKESQAQIAAARTTSEIRYQPGYEPPAPAARR